MRHLYDGWAQIQSNWCPYKKGRTSLLVQWLKLRIAMQGVWIPGQGTKIAHCMIHPKKKKKKNQKRKSVHIRRHQAEVCPEKRLCARSFLEQLCKAGKPTICSTRQIQQRGIFGIPVISDYRELYLIQVRSFCMT